MENHKFKKPSVVSKVIFSYLTDVTDIWMRKDISAVEKWRVIFWLFLSKLQRKNVLRVFNYVIHSNSRSNSVGILKEVFLKGDYAFKSDSYTPSIIDAGGNIGIATLFFKRYFPHSRVIVFEAGTKNFQFLKENIERNHLKDVTAVFGALGKKGGGKRFLL